jgi:manganese/iron transport system permease protein
MADDPAWWALTYDVLTLRYDFMRHSLIGTMLVGAACGLLGCFIILRRLALFGDALGHAVLPGVMLGYLWGGKAFFAIFAGAVVTGLMAAALVGWIPRASRHRSDTAIGIVFTGFFGAGVALLSCYQMGTSGVTTFLFGRALAIGPSEVVHAAWMLAGVILFLTLAYRPMVWMTFDPVGAVAQGVPVGALTGILMVALTGTVVVSLPIVGAVLVVALLVIPGATAYLLVDRLAPMFLIAAIVGAVSSLGGLLLSHMFAWASGAAMVLAAAFCFVMALIWNLSRRKNACLG